MVVFGWAAPPPMIEVMAAARAAVKFGSAVMAAVAALTVSANEAGCGCCNVGGAWWADSMS